MSYRYSLLQGTFPRALSFPAGSPGEARRSEHSPSVAAARRSAGWRLPLYAVGVLCLISTAPPVRGAGVLTSNGSLSDTQAKINQAIATGEDGWTVIVGAPGGTYNWSSSLSIPAGVSLTIQGAGTYSPDTRPTINITHSNNTAISMWVKNGKVTRLTNLKFVTSASPTTAIWVNGWSDRPSWRLDHLRFDNMKDRAIIVGDPDSNSGGIGPYGLVDNCWFESTGTAYNGIYIYFGNDSKSWTTPHSFGTDKTVVVEDCVFHRTAGTVPGKPALDSSYAGARWLLRYSTLTNWVVVLHGADSAPTSTLQFEFNHNTIRVNDTSDYALYIRGGTGVATGNDIGITGNPNNAGYNSAWKMVRDGPCGSGYPCFQQVGRGVVNGAEGSVPVYFWNNIYNLGNSANGAIASAESDIQLNRDYFLSAKPGYTELVYPHPLRSADGNTQTPEAPTNLSAIVQ